MAIREALEWESSVSNQETPARRAGIKLFYRQDSRIFTPTQVMSLQPTPSVVIYQ